MEIKNIALGSTGIAAAREELGNIEKAVQNVRETNERFINLYKDDNFQKFVFQTTWGANTNDQLVKLSSWIDSMCSIIEKLKNESENYISEQERINS